MERIYAGLIRANPPHPRYLCSIQMALGHYKVALPRLA